MLYQTQTKEKNKMELGRIEHGHFVQGDMKFAVDTTDAHKTFDAVAALPNPDKIKLAKLNNIPCEPFNKQALTTVLKSVVQNAWFANKLGTVPDEVSKGHTSRVARYTSGLAMPTSQVDFLSRKTRAASATRKVLLFTIDEPAYEKVWKDWRSQSYLVIKTMITLGAGSTGKSTREIFDNCSETRETTKPTTNAVNQILHKLIAAGIVKCLNPEDARQKKSEKSVGDKTSPTAKTPAAPSKKTTGKK